MHSLYDPGKKMHFWPLAEVKLGDRTAPLGQPHHHQPQNTKLAKHLAKLEKPGREVNGEVSLEAGDQRPEVQTPVGSLDIRVRQPHLYG